MARGRRSSVCSALGYLITDPSSPQDAAAPGMLSQSHLPPQSPLVPPHTLPSPAAAPLPLILSGSLTMWIMIPLISKHCSRVTRGVGFAGKTQQLRPCACSCSAAPTPQGRHPGHEYIQDIWINENISSLEPNVNQALLKSTEIKYLPVLKELIQSCSLLDPKQLLSRS